MKDKMNEGLDDPPVNADERTNLITPQGYKNLLDELNALTKVERPQIVVDVTHAARQGDRSENAEYQYGKKRLREIDRRVRFLIRRMELARIIEPTEQVADCVRFGATVTVQTDAGAKKIYQIVGEDEIQTLAGKISWKSPLGRGLMKGRIGDGVEVETPGGVRGFVILEIVYK